MTTQAIKPQKTAQSQVTAVQSTSIVRTLMMASLGCITYLRGLLPDENFNDEGVHPPSRSDHPSTGSSEDINSGGLRIKTIKKNYSPEGDKLIQWIDEGVMDAVEKGYLKAMVLSIYMDPKDPLNVIETYTFNFKYYDVPGVGSVPVLSVEQNLKSMAVSTNQDTTSLFGNAQNKKPLTLGQVKKATKNLLKQLILMTQNLAELPRKRCISVTLFYEDHTPEDYQPPMFCHADNERDRMYFATHGPDEAPEVLNIDTLETGHHGVSVKIRSIAEYLPVSHADHDSAYYFSNQGKGEIDSDQGRKLDEQSLERDEENRTYLWDAQKESVEGDIGDDDTHSQEELASYMKEDIANVEPDIPEKDPITTVLGKIKKGEGDFGHRMSARRTSMRLNTLAHPELFDTQSQNTTFPETQPINSSSSFSQTGLAKYKALGSPLTPFADMDEDPIQSFPNSMEVDKSTKRPSSSHDAQTGEDWSPCWCLDHREEGDASDDWVACDNIDCKVYMHVWCTGRQQKEDFENDESFFCLDCRLRNDERCAQWSEQDFEDARQQFRSLALFRRALMVTYDNRFSVDTKIVSKRLGCEMAEARAISQRLELEGFIKITTGKKNKRSLKVSKSSGSMSKLASYFNKHSTLLEDMVVGLADANSENDDMVGNGCSRLASNATALDMIAESIGLAREGSSTQLPIGSAQPLRKLTPTRSETEDYQQPPTETESQTQAEETLPANPSKTRSQGLGNGTGPALTSQTRSPKRKPAPQVSGISSRKKYRMSTATSGINLGL